MELKAEKRTITGKAVNALINKGLIPAIIYGRKFPATAISLDLKEFNKVYKEAGESGLIDVKVQDSEPVKVLVKDVQFHPLTDLPIHADFYKVDLSEKVTTMVPVTVVGVSEAVKSGQAMLLTPISELEVEALPLDLPSEITVDISGLLNVGDHLTVKDLKIDTSKIEIKHDPDGVVAKLDYAAMKEEEVVTEETTPEEIEITKEKKPEEGGEETEKETKPATKEEKKDKK